MLVVGRRRRRRISDTAACRQSFGSCQPVRTDIICANQLLYFDILRAQVFQHSPHSPLSSSPAAPNTCSVSVTDWYCYYYYFIKLPGDDGTGGTGGCCSFSLAHHRTYYTVQPVSVYQLLLLLLLNGCPADWPPYQPANSTADPLIIVFSLSAAALFFPLPVFSLNTHTLEHTYSERLGRTLAN